ncbi:MAG: cyclase family protein, partial [Clostridia bacterium]|nr:cyclase family protein [Clostridia bacterium]
MKIYDISQEVYGCEVYPGDPTPKKEILCSLGKGDVCNLTQLSMCAHNGTHLDAPYHFFDNGKRIDQIPLDRTVGFAYIAEAQGDISHSMAEQILSSATSAHPGCEKKILIKGGAVVT